MGKNLYEVPRDKNKWHTQTNKASRKEFENVNKKLKHLEELKNRFKKNNK